MKIGKLSIGRREMGTSKFYFFHSPHSAFSYNPYKHFWWVGKRWYICIEK